MTMTMTTSTDSSDLLASSPSLDTLTTMNKSHFERLSFALGLLTGIGCNMSSFGLCFLINVVVMAHGSVVDNTQPQRYATGLWEVATMVIGGGLICSMAVATLMLGNALLTMTYKMTRRRGHGHGQHGHATTSKHGHDDDNDNDEATLMSIVNQFECRFLMGTIASGASTILLVLASHWMNWMPSNKSYHGVPWLLYSTEVLLAFCFWAVWYCERSYQADSSDKKNDDNDDSLSTPLLSAATIV